MNQTNETFMNPKALYYYSRKKFYDYKYRTIQATKQLLPPKKHVVFSFLTEHWPGMGCELYAQEEVFRHYIQKCDVVVCKLGGNSILHHFEGKDPEFFDDGSNAFFGTTSLHISYYELLKSKGVLPNAVMGISLGEIAAVYAAGGLSLEDALKVAACCLEIHKKVQKNYLPVIIHAGFLQAESILEKSPVFLPIVYEVTENSVIGLCNESEREMAVNFLEHQGVPCSVIPSPCYPYHTQLLLPFGDFSKNLISGVEHKPLRCDFYSSLLGKIVPEGSILDNDYWFEEQCRPILMHSLLSKTRDSQLMLKIGFSTLFTGRHINQLKGRPLHFTDTFVRGQSELDVLKNAMRHLRKAKLEHSSLNKYNGDELAAFLQKINFFDLQAIPDPLPYLKYLQKKGSVHYLPKTNEWVVLDYEDIEYVLKHPETFSSTIHKTFDEFLIGADPPSHTLVRSLLQPLFSQQRLVMLADYISFKTGELLKGIEARPSFNFVDELALPLSQATIAKFIGFTEKENIEIQKCIQGYPYEMNFFESLRAYCHQFLQNPRAAENNTVGKLLLKEVKEGRLPFDGAVGVMRTLWVAGMITTSMLMSTAVLFLSKDPDLIPSLQEDDHLLNKFIEECLRLDAPETEARRITTKETELGGQVLPAGAMVVLKFKAANRDPKYFDNPDTICLTRSEKKHLSFGGGYHYCLGAGLARLEAKTVLKQVLQKLSEWKIDERAVEYFSCNHFRAIKKLPVSVGSTIETKIV
jgi:cytochrome P450